MGRVFDEDVRTLAQDPRIDWDILDNRRVLVTGATGLIGRLIAYALITRNEIEGIHTKVILPARNIERAAALFDANEDTEIVHWDALTTGPDEVPSADYIIHLASNTDSRRMVEAPVETILTTTRGCECMLEVARRSGASMVFASSMEVYGAGSDGYISEEAGGALDAMSVRSSYPQAKQLAETLCASYAQEYNVQVTVARLAQTFGAGIPETDRRIFGFVARNIIAGDDIKLATDGSKKNMYSYTTDSVRALLLLLTRGEAGRAYNVANEQTLASVREICELVAATFNPKVRVLVATSPQDASRFAVSGQIALDTSRIRALGFEPDYGLEDLYRRMMADWECPQ